MKKLVPLPYKSFYGLCNPRKTFLSTKNTIVVKLNVEHVYQFLANPYCHFKRFVCCA